MSIVVLGDLMVDVLAVLPGELAHGSDTPAPIEQHLGGSGANVAAWLAASGIRVAFVGRAGTDAFGAQAVGALRDAGVDVHVAHDARRPTGTCIVLVYPGGERTMVPDAGANDGLEPTGLPPGEHLHVAGYALLREGSRAAARSAITLATGLGMTVSVDPSSAAPLTAVGPKRFLEWTAGVGLLVPNAEEAWVLTGEKDPERAVRALAQGREAVVTLGPAGAIWSDGEGVVHAAAERVDVIDTTGAGDAFAAGLLAARHRGAGPAEALAAGNRLANRAVGRTGAWPLRPAAVRGRGPHAGEL
jgi:ribokinase